MNDMTDTIDAKPTEASDMVDVQSSHDNRAINIDKVGIKDIRHPVQVKDRSGHIQHAVANFNMYVDLPHEFKGTHMSRFVEILNSHDWEITVESFKVMLTEMTNRLDAVTSLCPCSKKISDRGAHNQRSHVTVTIKTQKFVWIEEIIDIVESQASCELYGLLKRPDEKVVTERAYDNPKFVEDIVRDIAAQLNKDDRILSYTVESENFESIHNHSAYALIHKDKD